MRKIAIQRGLKNNRMPHVRVLLACGSPLLHSLVTVRVHFKCLKHFEAGLFVRCVERVLNLTMLLLGRYAAEIGSRMRPGNHYLDYTGSSLYCNSQLEAAFQELKSHVFGNPHSANPSSELTTDKVEEVRDMVLRFFNADPLEYNVVFTPSATGSLKLVGETFPWTKYSQFRQGHADFSWRPYPFNALALCLAIPGLLDPAACS